MDDLDVLLRESNPMPGVSIHAGDLATELARSRVRGRPRRRLIVALVSVLGGALVLGGGGLAAAAQAGWFGSERFVDGPDMAGTRVVTVSPGVRYECKFVLHAEGDYQQASSYQRIADGLLEAHRYMRTLKPADIRTDPSLLDPDELSQPMPDSVAEWTRARTLFRAWQDSVIEKVDGHLADLKLPPVVMSAVVDCQLAPAK